ncbi:MarR family transcriptional regulator [Microbacterium sp. LjRoot45]|uniref:MarR family transcriptional regulator n=1 Tax=Candidatus Microbacterium phytovorans TaxID=3121374 RepID=A0AAJ5W076_9MICO|nr:MarR family transcriptional regulator [Microbacterium sp.]WEK12848.1 MAG: MarR family transcriptional regulator [Microbacterium sp.]
MARVTPPGLDPIDEARRQWVAHGWADAAAGMTAVTSVMRAHQLLLARVGDALKPFDLSFARYELLTLLSFSREGRMPLTSAARRLQVHPTSVTNTVDRLEAAGLVRREAHPTDGRATLVALTDAGRATAERATAALNEEVFSRTGLGDADLEALIGTISRLRAASGDTTA